MEATSRGFVSLPIQRPPSSRSRLFFPNVLPVAGENSPCLQDILDIRQQGLSFGYVGFGNHPYESNGQFLRYRWDIDNLDNKHIFIVGESGSGKTVLLKNLAFELRRNNRKSRIILTDVQGDITQLMLRELVEPLEGRGWQKQVDDQPTAQEIESALSPFQLLIPARPDGSLSPNLIALKTLLERKGVIVRTVGLRLQDVDMPSDVEYLFRVSSEQAGMLLDDEAEYLANQGQAVTLARLRQAVTSLQASAARANSQAPSHGGTNYFGTTFSAALRALRSLESYFDYHQESLQNSANPLDYLNFDGTTILFLDELDEDERIMWEMQMVRWLYANKKEHWNAFVFFDEAHQIIPARPSGQGASGTFDRLRTNFERLAREGRKFGINLVLSTQNPRDLHPIVPEQCPTRIVMKLNPRNAEYAGLEKELAMIANRFGQGQMWIQSPFNGTANWVRVHSAAPPLPHEPMTSFWRNVMSAARNG